MDLISNWERYVALGTTFAMAGALALDVALHRENSYFGKGALEKTKDLHFAVRGDAAQARLNAAACYPRTEADGTQVYKLRGQEFPVRPALDGRQGDIAMRAKDSGLIVLHTGECYVFQYNEDIPRLDFTTDREYLYLGNGQKVKRYGQDDKDSAAQSPRQLFPSHTPG